MRADASIAISPATGSSIARSNAGAYTVWSLSRRTRSSSATNPHPSNVSMAPLRCRRSRRSRVAFARWKPSMGRCTAVGAAAEASTPSLPSFSSVTNDRASVVLPAPGLPVTPIRMRPPDATCSRRARSASTPSRSGSDVRGCLFLGGFAVLDDVAVFEQDALRRLAPLGFAPHQELELHAEVLVLLAERVGHDRLRLAVGFDGDALFVPTDRLGLLGEAGAHSGEGSHLARELTGWLVVLVGRHGSAPFTPTAGCRERTWMAAARPAPTRCGNQAAIPIG